MPCLYLGRVLLTTGILLLVTLALRRYNTIASTEADINYGMIIMINANLAILALEEKLLQAVRAKHLG
jgi:hypothetical protein